MIKAVVTSGAVVAACLGISGPAAHAGPPPPCSFALTPPAVVQVDGVSLVKATVSPAQCDGPADPRLAVACVQRQDDATSMQCIQARSNDVAQVYVPYQPGATYVATGRGCGAWAGMWEIDPNCDQLGPLTATL